MSLIIDGHNLIPKIPGLALSDLDDEMRLVELVNEYCRLTRNRAELFFDGAPPAQRPSPTVGLVHPHYIRKGTSADDAIIAFLHQAKKSAKNNLVVTSDHRIQAEARAVGCTVMTSEVFASEMIHKFRNSPATESKKERNLSEKEVDQWLDIFGTGQDKDS